MKKTSYSDSFDADEQITAEEQIAAYLFHNEHVEDEEEAKQISEDVLYLVLRHFRPDLLKKKHSLKSAS